jgi:hypothetical protein
MEQVLYVLNGLVSGVVTVPLVVWVLTFLAARGVEITDGIKNIAAFVMPFVLAAVGQAGLVYFAVVALPEPTTVAWINFVVPILGLAYTTSQALYKAIWKPAIASATK